ncbi:permease [Sinorhizobium medicae]|uniref:Permease n=1 Tax=Sinorhizobium medicae TaxID=110321 RepID=A0ABX4TGZ8_9HYPH|nr:permease [Sinorhizobium medicae]PLT97160.1 permease [Sinorhizobium medicae]PLT97656.1 permease [Sinorhizobium medicae]PLU04334.1 permease [Sinorhizobium medicae]PLU16314.1 permease [Sinorhizobium medicae]
MRQTLKLAIRPKAPTPASATLAISGNEAYMTLKFLIG